MSILEKSLHWQCGSLMQDGKMGEKWFAEDYQMKTEDSVKWNQGYI